MNAPVAMIPSTMADIRKTVLDELARRKWSHYQLAKAVEGHASPDTVYKWLGGTRNITVKFLEPILEALGLEVRRKR